MKRKWLKSAKNNQIITNQSNLCRIYQNNQSYSCTILIDFERYPVGIEPYDNVLKEFDLPDVKSSVKMFYSINELGREQSTKQIGAIIDRNNKLSGQTEEMKNKDRIGIAAMYSVIPMFLGVLKIIVDMLLMILVFTSSISEVVKWKNYYQRQDSVWYTE